MIDRTLMRECRHVLGGHGAVDMAEQLKALAASPHAGGAADFYGDGPAVKALCARVGGMTGHEATQFALKGMVAQMAAFKVWTARSGRPTVAVHRLSHVDYDELGAAERVGGLTLLRTGPATGPFRAADLDALGEKPGVVSVELPLRRAGYRLLPLSDLRDIAAWCRDEGVPLHIDGARAWGVAVAYGVELAELAGLADSLYLSFYKELGGLAGCTLSGSRRFIDEATPWITRLGGDVFRVFPYAVAALEGLDRHLPALGGYQDFARRIAEAVNGTEGAHCEPSLPHTNGFQIVLGVGPGAAEAVLEGLTRETGVWLTAGFYPRPNENECAFDVEIGSAAASLSPEEWAAHIGALVARARAHI